MSLEQYRLVQHDKPYILKVCSAASELLYLGVEHSVDAQSISVATIVSHLNRFKPQLVLVEGPVTEPPSTFEGSVQQLGEVGAAIFAARAAGIAVASLDFHQKTEIDAVVNAYGRLNAAVFYGVRYIAQERRNHPYFNLQELLRKTTSWLHKNGALHQEEIATDEYERIVAARLQSFTSWEAIQQSWFDPFEGVGKMQQIASFLVIARDIHMSKLIVESLRTNERVLAEAGVSHVIMQEDELTAALGCRSAVWDKDVRQSPSIHECSKRCLDNH